jgi:hypothetical protein
MHKYFGVAYFSLLGLSLIGLLLPKPYFYIAPIAIITYCILRLTIMKDDKKETKEI